MHNEMNVSSKFEISIDSFPDSGHTRGQATRFRLPVELNPCLRSLDLDKFAPGAFQNQSNRPIVSGWLGGKKQPLAVVAGTGDFRRYAQPR